MYVQEAHPTDGWRSPGNDRVGISFAQPREKKQRADIAVKCSQALEITMPVVVDDMDDRVGHLYSGMPDRLYLIDRNGRVAYKGGRGPFGFKSRELEQVLIMQLVDESSALAQAGGSVSRPASPKAPVPVAASLAKEAKAGKAPRKSKN